MPKPVSKSEVKATKPESTEKDNFPEHLKPFYFHRLEFSTKSDKSNTVVSECPFCSKPDRMAIENSTGQWNCFNCKSGNILTFIRDLWSESFELTTIKDYDDLAKLRGLDPDLLKDWGFAKSITSDEWIIPGFDKPGGKIIQLYVYRKPHSDNGKIVKPILLATPTLSHGWFCSHNIQDKNNYSNKKVVQYIAEGPWDGVRLQEVMSKSKETEVNGALTLKLTNNVKYSLLSESNVLATPGCSVFKDSWTTLFKDKSVVFMFDNDHPKQNKNGQVIPPAGTAGVERAAQKLLVSPSTAPSEVHYLCWGEEGYDPDVPSGTDLRDWLKSKTDKGAVAKLDQLLNKVVDVPQAWLEKAKSKGDSDNKLSLIDCHSFDALIEQWNKALRWTDGLDVSLSVMLSSIISTTSVGDQLWVKVIGPASCGKSTLCEAVSVADKYVMAKSTIRGFVTGYMDTEGGEDLSLVSKLKNKTLVTKDGDTLLQSPNLSQILSEARDLYDTVTRTSYRNKASKDYQGIRMTWILCGTSSLRSIDSSELGERFLDCVLMDGIDEELEDDILRRVAYRSVQNLDIEATADVESQQDPNMTLAMQMTGGYVTYLRENAQSLLSKVTITDEDIITCTRLGKFVAYMRARPSKFQTETAEREFAARLVSQHVRMMKCLAAVLNRTTIDREVMRRTFKVSLDTARGIILNLVEIIREEHERDSEGVDLKQLSFLSSHTLHEVSRMVHFMRQLGIVEFFSLRHKNRKPVKKIRLTEMMESLCEDVLDRYDTELYKEDK